MRKFKGMLLMFILAGFLAVMPMRVCAAEGDIDSGTAGKTMIWRIDSNGKLTAKGDISGYNWNTAPWHNGKGNHDKILSAEIDIQGLTNTMSFFSGCKNLKSVTWKSFDTSQVTNMSHMFYECVSLESLDLSGFDTGKVTNMSNMFDERLGGENLVFADKTC